MAFNMQKYIRVERKKEDEEETPIGENEIRVTQKGKVGKYVSYAHRIFEKEEKNVILLKGLGNAISKCITVSEVIKRTTPDLYQITQVGSMETVDVYEPIEEGLDVVNTVRHLPTINITLSKSPLDKNDPGYQEMSEEMNRDAKTSAVMRASGRGRGGRRAFHNARGRMPQETNKRDVKEESSESPEHKHEQGQGQGQSPVGNGKRPEQEPENGQASSRGQVHSQGPVHGHDYGHMEGRGHHHNGGNIHSGNNVNLHNGPNVHNGGNVHPNSYGYNNPDGPPPRRGRGGRGRRGGGRRGGGVYSNRRMEEDNTL